MGEATAWLTWLLGTGFNATTAAVYPTSSVIASSVAWQWLVSSQLIEAFLWRSLNVKQDGNELNKRMTQLAFTQQMMVPLVFGLAYLVIGGASDSYQMMAVGFMLVYLFYLMGRVRALHPSHTMVKPSRHDKRWLDYTWWTEAGFRHLGPIYTVCTLVQPLLLVRPVSFGLMQAAYLAGSGLVARNIAAHAMPAGWAWLASLGPAFNGMFWWMARKHPVLRSRQKHWDWTFV